MSLFVREMQKNNNEILPQVCQIAIINKSANNKYWRGYREKGTLMHHWWK